MDNNNLKNEWKILIEAWRNSGMTKKGWCRANNQSINNSDIGMISLNLKNKYHNGSKFQ